MLATVSDEKPIITYQLKNKHIIRTTTVDLNEEYFMKVKLVKMYATTFTKARGFNEYR